MYTGATWAMCFPVLFPYGDGVLGLERDAKLRQLTWKTGGRTYHLKQSKCDSQCWIVKDQQTNKTHGLVMVYVDDFLILTESGSVRKELKQALRDTWSIGAETELERGTTISFIGLELDLEADQTLKIHQTSFCKSLLAKHGLDPMSYAITTIQTGRPEGERAPTAAELKSLQQYDGEYNWLSTHARPDKKATTLRSALPVRRHIPTGP